MFEANVKIIKELKLFVSLVIENPELVETFSTQSNAFTRKRKLPFDRLVLLIAKLCKKTLSVEIEKFLEEMKIEMSCSVSAFTQQRMKLKPNFYKVWNEVLIASFYHYYGTAVHRWKGYRLVAADGSNLSLINTPVLQAYFGGQSNQQCSFVQGKIFYCYDILNELMLLSELQPYRTGELPMAYFNMNSLEKDMLMIYDRNFFNYKMIALHQWQESQIKFVIRAKESSPVIRSFKESKKKSAIIYLIPTTSAIAELPKSGYKIDKNTLLKVRLVRVNLENSIEVLATNLWEEEGHGVSRFKELYFRRWNIETNISLQKNIFQLESFSGLTVQSVMQDFYATVFMNNLHSIIIKDAQQSIESADTKRKYPMKINKNKSHGKLRSNVVELFMTHKPKIILQKLHDYFIRDPVPIRKGRSFPRMVKNKQLKSKHKTFMNYKPAF